MNNRPNEPQNDNNTNSPFGGRNAQRFWLIIAGVVILLFIFVFAAPGQGGGGNNITLDKFAQFVKDNQVKSVIVQGGQEVRIELKSGEKVSYYKERETDLFSALKTFGVTETYLPV